MDLPISPEKAWKLIKCEVVAFEPDCAHRMLQNWVPSTDAAQVEGPSPSNETSMQSILDVIQGVVMSDIPEPKVVVVGPSAIDIIFEGVDHMPNLGGAVIARTCSVHTGGVGLNAAVGLAKLGIKTLLITPRSTNPADLFARILWRRRSRGSRSQ